jgi:hypothetical protein
MNKMKYGIYGIYGMKSSWNVSINPGNIMK